MSKRERQLIIGMGQVGEALMNILGSHAGEVCCRDAGDDVEGSFAVLPICYLYTPHLVREARHYIRTYQPEL